MLTNRVKIWGALCIAYIIVGIYFMATDVSILGQFILIATGIGAFFTPLFYYLFLGILLFCGLKMALDD